MCLDLVPISAPVLLFLFLHDVARCGQIGDDAISASLRNAEGGGDVAQTDPGVVGDAQEDPSMICEKVPSLHSQNHSLNLHETIC